MDVRPAVLGAYREQAYIDAYWNVEYPNPRYRAFANGETIKEQCDRKENIASIISRFDVGKLRIWVTSARRFFDRSCMVCSDPMSLNFRHAEQQFAIKMGLVGANYDIGHKPNHNGGICVI